MAIGPASPALIAQFPGLQNQLSMASGARQQFALSAAATVSSTLSAPQQAIWETAQANHLIPPPFRYAPSLSAAQLHAIQTTPATAAGSVLNVTQQQAVSAAIASINQNLSSVQAAEDALLPLPDALKIVPATGTPPPQ